MNKQFKTISLCMIVKNEEQNLGTCLKSCREWVDEIIIVDTGSEDGTIEIAEAYNAAVYHAPWQEDFSQARNISLQYASKDWILILDADEELPLQTAQNLKAISADTEADAWTFLLISPLSFNPESQTIKHTGLRMFKNKKNYRFAGPVHEQIAPSLLQDDAVIKHSGLSILHHGYKQEKTGRKEKTLRNIRLLNEALTLFPGNAFYHYNLGVSYYRLRELEQSRIHYEKAFEYLHGADSFSSAMYRDYCICLSELGEYAEARRIADRGIALYPDYPDLYFIQGLIFYDTGMYRQAKRSFQQCTGFEAVLPEYVSTEGIIDYLAYENLAEICEKTGELDEACEYVRLAIGHKPLYRLFSRLCKVLKQMHLTGEEIQQEVQNYLEPDESTISLLFEHGFYNNCYDIINTTKHPNLEMQLLKIKCLQHLSVAGGIKPQYLPTGGSFHHSAAMLKELCILMWIGKDRQDASSLIAAFSAQEDPVLSACRYVNKMIFPDENPLSLPDQESDYLLNMAVSLLEAGDKDLAMAIVQELCNQERGEAYYLLGKSMAEKGRYDEAKLLLERALDNCSSAADAYYQLAMACAGVGLHDMAFGYYWQAAQANQDESYAACALAELGAYLMQSLRQVLATNPENSSLQGQIVRLASIKQKADRLQAKSSLV